jgi:hypothetical protein
MDKYRHEQLSVRTLQKENIFVMPPLINRSHLKDLGRKRLVQACFSRLSGDGESISFSRWQLC